jgi:tetratricopeptide (TPR) repeat protein
MKRVRILLLAVVILASTGSAAASWYDDYEAGTVAARKGQWSVVIKKMNDAIAGNPNEADKARTYSTIFINYHPYYYRGVAYLNTGKFQQAITDFEKTTGPGDVDLGSLETVMQRAKMKLEAANATPAPEPQPQAAPPPAPVPAPVRQPVPQPVPQPPPATVPAAPSIDNALRQHVTAQINAATSSLAKARGRNATGAPQYQQAVQALADASSRLSTARNNDDLRAAMGLASNATVFADAAAAPAHVASKPAIATELVLSDARRDLRRALTNYFNGDFKQASGEFESLTKTMPRNGYLWAFLGASKYSQYAFEADDTYKEAAVAAFRKAKAQKAWTGGLPDRYFSRRIRRFYDTLQ